MAEDNLEWSQSENFHNPQTILADAKAKNATKCLEVSKLVVIFAQNKKRHAMADDIKEKYITQELSLWKPFAGIQKHIRLWNDRK